MNKQWAEDRYQVGCNTGNTSYAALALLQYDAVFSDDPVSDTYVETAAALMDWVIDNCSDGGDGFTGGCDGWPEADPPVVSIFTYKSIEHNIDAYAAFLRLYVVTGEERYREAAESALRFIDSMYDRENGVFCTGTYEDGVTPDRENIVLDAQVWAALALVSSLISKGCRDFAFAGDVYTYNIGCGFQERYDALIEELSANGLALNEKASMLRETDLQLMNISYIVSFLKRLDHLPQVYLCGNDWTAIQLMHGIQFLGYSVPRDVSVIGFDNIPESTNTLPPLTTINTPKERLGIAAARCLLERISDPVIPYVYSQYMTDIVIRGSSV